jgi:hypothetical protein
VAADGDGFGEGLQRLSSPAHHYQAHGEGVQAFGEVGQEGVGAGRGQMATDGEGFGDGLGASPCRPSSPNCKETNPRH